MNPIKKVIEENKKHSMLLTDLIEVVSDTDILDTPDVEVYFRNTDPIVNSRKISNAWNALSLHDSITNAQHALIDAVIEAAEGMKDLCGCRYEGETKCCHEDCKICNGTRNQALDDIITLLKEAQE